MPKVTPDIQRRAVVDLTVAGWGAREIVQVLDLPLRTVYRFREESARDAENMILLVSKIRQRMEA